MSESNGRPREPTRLERIVAELPYLSDAERGRLRAILCRGDMVRREGVTRPKREERES